MKNLKTFLFLGLITLFTSTAFSQDPHPTKFDVQTEHAQSRSTDNGQATIKRGSAEYNNNYTSRSDGDGFLYNLKDNWMDYYREAIMISLF